MRKFTSILYGLLAMTVADWAYACPLCHTSTADEVRAGIAATAQDGAVFLALFGPFVALSVVLGLLNRFTPDDLTTQNERSGQ